MVITAGHAVRRGKRGIHTEDRLLVFISSVMRKELEDLQAERDACLAAIGSLPLTRPWAFEHSTASPDPARKTYIDKVDACDIFLIVLGVEITDPVEDEYNRAVERGKRRLVFLKRTTDRSQRLTKWIDERQDVTYVYFGDAEELADKVRAAVINELIRGYRVFNLKDKDYESIVGTIRSTPVTFIVRTIEPKELPEVTSTFPELQQLYPDFEAWTEKKRVEIAEGKAEACVANYGGENAGFALTTDKDPMHKVRKISTLYIKPRYQHQGIGPRLLFGLLERAAQEGVEKLYVTVSEERRQQLEVLLDQYGFFVEGVSGRRYRRGSCEWVWTKHLLYGRLRRAQLYKFVQRYMFEERGFVVQRLGSGMFTVFPRYGVLGQPSEPGAAVLVATASGEDPERQYRAACRKARELGLRLVFVSIEPLPSIHEYGMCFDSLDLEARFFPLYVERDTEGLIVPIREEYVQRLIPLSDRPQFLVPTRVQLRTDNVYYRYPSAFSGLKRGSPLFFYETQRGQGRSRLIGEGKLLGYDIAEPQDLLARYGNLGVYTLDDVRKCVIHRGQHNGKALALQFDWYRELACPLPRERIEHILPHFDPTTARRLGTIDILELRRLAGWNVDTLSLL
jgi:ribosomal protein S18 acetylase RimI-like enzyme